MVPSSDRETSGVSVSGVIGVVHGDIVGGNKYGLSEDGVRQLLREELARDRGLDPELLRPIFDNLGELGLSRDQLLAKAEQGIAALLQRARTAVAPTNDGADIDAAIQAARDKLRVVDTRAARNILATKIAEEEDERRRRLIPLLAEQAAIERASFDYPAAQGDLAASAGDRPRPRLVMDRTRRHLRDDRCARPGDAGLSRRPRGGGTALGRRPA